jgi:hypothetical protein
MIPREVIWWPMVIVAALELANGSNIDWRGMGLLAFLHALVLGLALRSDDGFCGVRRLERWRLDDL